MIVPSLLALATSLVVFSSFVGALWLVRLATVERPRTRALASVVSLAWFALAIVLSATHFFVPGTPPPPVPSLALTMLPLFVLVLAMTFSTSFRARLDAIPRAALVRVQVFRLSGMLVLAHWAGGALPVEFALPTGLGSTLVGLASIVVAARLARSESPDVTEGRTLAKLWNALGLLELALALPLGAKTAPTHPMLLELPMVTVAAFLVPLSFFLHFASLRSLRSRDSLQAQGVGSRDRLGV